MKKSEFKKSKMGKLPGEFSIRTKIRIIEEDGPISIFPWQELDTKPIKAFRKMQRRRAEKRLRQKRIDDALF